MRVTHIITRLIIGGAQENTVATVLGLRQKPDVQVDLISGPTSGPEGSMEPLVANVPGLLTVVPTLIRPVSPWLDFRALQGLTKLLRDHRPDIVHTHSGKAGFLGRLAARRARIPVIIHHIHGPSFGPFQGPLANWLLLTAERIAGKRTTHFVCSADAMTRRYLQAGIGRPEMYTRVFSGFKLEPFIASKNDLEFRKTLGLPPDAFVVGKIARLAPLKGHDDLLQAAAIVTAELPSARFLLLGDGSLRPALEARARKLGLADKVLFPGLVSPTDVPKYVGIMDSLVHLSAREAVSRALPQALAAAKPVVSYDFDGADEVCIEGKTGFLIKMGDFRAAASAVLKLARDPALRQRLGSEGQAFVRDSFRVEQMFETLYNLYSQLLARNHPRY